MRIGSIDVYKFLFSWVIAYFHFYGVTSPNEHFPLGSVVVEFFVLVSGVFLFTGWDKSKINHLQEAGCRLSPANISPYTYLKRRFFRFFPYTTVAFVFAFTVRVWLWIEDKGTLTLDKILGWLSDDIWEILLVKMNGMNNNGVLLNRPVWSLSAMLIAEFVIIALLVNREKLFYTLICPCSILIGLGVWRHIEVADSKAWIGFTTFGVLRVFIVTCLSWYSYKLICKLKDIRITQNGKIFFTICEFLLYGVTIPIIMRYGTRNFRWITILCFLFATVISISGVSYTVKLFPSAKWTLYLGELSMGIFLIHYPIFELYKYFWPEPYEMFSHKFSFAAIVLVAAIFFCWLVKGIKKTVSYLSIYIRPKLIDAD